MASQEQIHEKGFSMRYNPDNVEFGKIKVGPKILDDATITLGAIKKANRKYSDKNEIIKAIADRDVDKMREISNYYFSTNGIYQKACEYLASMYRYDWYIVPEVYDNQNFKQEKVVKEFVKISRYLDNSTIKKVCGRMALAVIRDGAYYGYCLEGNDAVVLQDLPAKYCRSRYSIGNNPAVEFNMRFFDEMFIEPGYRLRVLKMFPQEFAKGYLLYKQGKLISEERSDRGGWYLLDPNKTVKFDMGNGLAMPYLINAIPAIIDLDAAQDLDRKKQMQQLLKILVQKLPFDKNGELIFDIDEATDIHNNAIEMLSRAIGVDVLTTFADIESIDLSDRNTTTTKDELQRVERTVYNDMGVSQNLFNATGNLSMNNSILQDEGMLKKLLLQFNAFYDRIAQSQSSNPKKCRFRLYMLETTQYNYKELSKLYKEQVQIGFSKVLPQVALGHSQSAIINTAYFENQILDLQEIMIPPLSSNVMNAETVGLLGKKKQSSIEGNKNAEASPGRPELDDSQKSEKTIANKEALG